MPEPRLSLIHDGQCHPAARVAELNEAGVRAEFEHDDVPLFASGQSVTASLCLHDAARAIEIPATVVFVAGRGACMVIALRFDTRVEDIATLGRAPAPAIERRTAPRKVELPAGLRATVRLDEAGGRSLAIDVIDHSPGGIGFRVDNAHAGLLNEGDAFALDLVVAPGRAPHALLARVRHRTVRDERVHYGCTYRTTA